MVAENYRFMPPVIAAKDMVERGELGTLRLVQLQEDFPFQPVEWRNDVELNGGGVLIDGGIHKAQPASPTWRAIHPKCTPQRCRRRKPGLSAEDGVVAMLRYPNGMVGVINHSWSAGPHAPRPWVTLSGSTASAVFELGSDWIDAIDATGRRRQQLDDDRAGLAGMVREFRRSVQENRPPAMTGEEGARDVALVEACYLSIRTGAPVTFP